MGLFGPSKTQMPTRDQALAGRDEVMAVPDRHFVLGSPLVAPFPPGAELAWFGLGCFWGAEKRFWSQDGVISTAVGYGGGFTANATYQEVCSGRTGHNELVQVVFDPSRIEYQDLLRLFWESHDPTQGMRQGNDIGTQYRSGIYVGSAQQRELAEASRAAYQARLDAGRRGAITTEIVDAGPFYYAEAYHQQYLAKNPGGYCGLGGTGIAFG
ncbi:peptide-methionine (S)-S-oxide reductase [Magnetospirillum moscoviense]|uniref:Peptide methionine sulfoxide reductase MsrA n=2 Tax=Magnetospirillum moscoviense TaxID=1437059 RepID=A0A178MYL6_9PROT|nr:peptide-methionine (S)-S-oxide reductase MsrA [Magnetospirillum moscoviense]OAN63329.1 peptide-methionine (S)-S-oxide reductase [Magnetospirillum moscoviense]